jgi:hypothetical protein
LSETAIVAVVGCALMPGHQATAIPPGMRPLRTSRISQPEAPARPTAGRSTPQSADAARCRRAALQCRISNN